MFGEVLRIKVTKFKQNLRENYSKSTKIVITARKFSKISRGSMPLDPLEPFLFLNQLQTSSAKKNALEMNERTMPPFLNFSLRHKLEVFAINKNFSIYSSLLFRGYYRPTICRPHKFWMKPLRWKVCSSLAKRDKYNCTLVHCATHSLLYQ